ncbi:uncharacterized protein DUF4923 [Dysgonomonas alginatilytica]|uniref:Uncharacterized protein DUF4923 n=1 Tax=Dysgonomonas alginatilytica TaxID=1605892 RepID=A0A2V3PI24_9BACT|nr:DUF4923 family protein [Dysgonomonas alginatilytica]PXV58848.1 uncharacterized protein DUF4923 [Dysgonomonas alginatilytica]
MKTSRFYLFMICLFLFSGAATIQGQSVKNVIKSTVDHFTALDLEGTWVYKEVAVKFESDNLLKKAGGKVAAARIESKLSDQLNQIGFEPGVTVFTFTPDSTFTNTTKGKKMSGKYTYDSSSKYITLKYLNHIPVKAKLSASQGKISLLFETGSFLSLVTFIGGHSGVGVIADITSLLKSYDGMMTGLELKKRE